MNPFLEIPVYLAGGANEPEKEVTGRIIPGEIAFHYPGYNWGAIIVLKSGYTVLTPMSCEEIDAARMAYDAFLRKNPGNQNNIILQPKKKLHATD